MKSVYCAVRNGSLNKSVCVSYLNGYYIHILFYTISWLRIGTGCGRFWMYQRNFWFHKTWGISWLGTFSFCNNVSAIWHGFQSSRRPCHGSGSLPPLKAQAWIWDQESRRGICGGQNGTNPYFSPRSVVSLTSTIHHRSIKTVFNATFDRRTNRRTIWTFQQVWCCFSNRSFKVS